MDRLGHSTGREGYLQEKTTSRHGENSMKTKNEENPALEPLNQSKSRGKRASQDSRIEPCFYPIQSATLSEIMQLKPSMQVKN